MDERAMHQLVDDVLAAYLSANPPPEGMIPVILLDSYRCHMMALVVSWIEAMGVEVIHVPGGCTGLCQPLVVSVNRSFKARLRQMWEEFLTHLLEQTDEVCNTTREEMSEWMAAVYLEMVGSCILRNCWCKMGYDWFPGLVDQEDVIAANTCDINNGSNGNDGRDDDEGNEDSYMSNEALFDSDKEGEESDDDDDSKDKGDD